MAQLVKNLPVMHETQVRSMGWEDPLEKEMATHSSILAWKIPWTEELEGCSPWGHKESDTTERLTHIAWCSILRDWILNWPPRFSLLGLQRPAEKLSVPLGSHILFHFPTSARADGPDRKHPFSNHPVPSPLEKSVLQDVTFPLEHDLKKALEYFPASSSHSPSLTGLQWDVLQTEGSSDTIHLETK